MKVCFFPFIPHKGAPVGRGNKAEFASRSGKVAPMKGPASKSWASVVELAHIH